MKKQTPDTGSSGTTTASDLSLQETRIAVLAAQQYRFRIPEGIVKLLYLSKERPPAALNVLKISIRVDLQNGISFDSRHDSADPSTIFLRSAIDEPRPNVLVEEPGYYPTYLGLTPAQKHLYLTWLQNIASPIDIGYVFIFYYGLERQLLLGDYDAAFHTIVQLRKYHRSNSLEAYSRNALVYSTVIRNRQDMLPYLYDLLDSDRWGNTELLLVAKSEQRLTANQLVSVISSLPNTNKNYIKRERETYRKQLEQAVQEKYGQPSFALLDYVDVYALPKTRELGFANISFPENVRALEVPDFLSSRGLVSVVSELAESAHDRTKRCLRELRKKNT